MLPKNGGDLLDSLALQVVPISAGWANQPMSSAVNDGYLQTGADAVRQPEQSKGFGRLKRRWGGAHLSGVALEEPATQKKLRAPT